MDRIRSQGRCARVAALLVTVLAVAGCGEKAGSGGDTAREPAGPPAHLLTVTPGEPIPVLQALERSEGEEVVVTGRVSKIENGVAAFTLTDASVPYCDQGEKDSVCTTPWDYCCHEAAAKKGSIPAELRGADGQPLVDANLGLRLLDLVVVKGTCARTEGGGKVLIVKDGWFRKERPELPTDLEWPK